MCISDADDDDEDDDTDVDDDDVVLVCMLSFHFAISSNAMFSFCCFPVGRQPSSGPPPQRGLHGQWVRLRVVKVKPPPLDVPRLAELGLGGCGLRPWAVELGLAEPGVFFLTDFLSFSFFFSFFFFFFS